MLWLRLEINNLFFTPTSSCSLILMSNVGNQLLSGNYFSPEQNTYSLDIILGALSGFASTICLQPCLIHLTK